MSSAEALDLHKRLTWVTPPECQGQIVLVSYALYDGWLFRRVHDQSDRSIVISRADADVLGDQSFEPWNSAPKVKYEAWRLVGSVHP